MKRIRTLVTLAVLLAAAPLWADWIQRKSLSEYGAEPGSALCSGVATEADNVTRSSVWMLHGGSNYFDRFCEDQDSGEWVQMSDVPSSEHRPHVYWGGSLAYVPDPFACPPNGWVFAFPGTGDPEYPSQEFLVFHPGEGSLGTWHSAPPVPDEEGVTGGAALCYGGGTMIGGRAHAILYAFTGQEDNVNDDWSGHFYRYVFELVPYDEGGSAPEQGEWEELTPVPDKVKPGGALTWCPNPDPQHPNTGGRVIAMTAGNNDKYLWRYDPTALHVWSGANPELADDQDKGACLTTRFDSSTVMMLYGGGYDSFSLCQPAEPPYPGWIETDSNPPAPDGRATKSRAGSAVTQIDNIVYAVFGTDNGRAFWAYRDDASREGGEGSSRPGLQAPLVAVRNTKGSSSFTVRCRPGPVLLRMFNSAGIVVSRTSTEARTGQAVLTWPNTSQASGVYLYMVSTPSGFVTGKVTVVRETLP